MGRGEFPVVIWAKTFTGNKIKTMRIKAGRFRINASPRSSYFQRTEFGPSTVLTKGFWKRGWEGRWKSGEFLNIFPTELFRDFERPRNNKGEVRLCFISGLS